MDIPNPAPESFKTEVASHYATLQKFAIGLCRNPERAEDLTQTAIAKAIHSWHQFNPEASGSNLKAWLFTILRNAHYSESRKTKREVEDPDDILAGTQLVTDAHQDGGLHLDTIYQRISLLPSDHQEVLWLVIEGNTYDEMAKKLGVAEGTVKSRVSRARITLAGLLNDAAFELPAEKWREVTLADQSKVRTRLAAPTARALLPNPIRQTAIAAQPKTILALPTPAHSLDMGFIEMEKIKSSEDSSTLEPAVERYAAVQKGVSSEKTEGVSVQQAISRKAFQSHIFELQAALARMGLESMHGTDAQSAFAIVAKALTAMPQQARDWWAQAIAETANTENLPQPLVVTADRLEINSVTESEVQVSDSEPLLPPASIATTAANSSIGNKNNNENSMDRLIRHSGEVIQQAYPDWKSTSAKGRAQSVALNYAAVCLEGYGIYDLRRIENIGVINKRIIAQLKSEKSDGTVGVYSGPINKFFNEFLPKFIAQAPTTMPASDFVATEAKQATPVSVGQLSKSGTIDSILENSGGDYKKAFYEWRGLHSVNATNKAALSFLVSFLENEGISDLRTIKDINGLNQRVIARLKNLKSSSTATNYSSTINGFFKKFIAGVRGVSVVPPLNSLDAEFSTTPVVQTEPANTPALDITTLPKQDDRKVRLIDALIDNSGNAFKSAYAIWQADYADTPVKNSALSFLAKSLADIGITDLRMIENVAAHRNKVINKLKREKNEGTAIKYSYIINSFFSNFVKAVSHNSLEVRQSQETQNKREGAIDLLIRNSGDIFKNTYTLWLANYADTANNRSALSFVAKSLSDYGITDLRLIEDASSLQSRVIAKLKTEKAAATATANAYVHIIGGFFNYVVTKLTTGEVSLLNHSTSPKKPQVIHPTPSSTHQAESVTLFKESPSSTAPLAARENASLGSSYVQGEGRDNDSLSAIGQELGSQSTSDTITPVANAQSDKAITLVAQPTEASDEQEAYGADEIIKVFLAAAKHYSTSSSPIKRAIGEAAEQLALSQAQIRETVIARGYITADGAAKFSLRNGEKFTEAATNVSARLPAKPAAAPNQAVASIQPKRTEEVINPAAFVQYTDGQPVERRDRNFAAVELDARKPNAIVLSEAIALAEIVLFIDRHKAKGAPLQADFLFTGSEVPQSFHKIFMEKNDNFHHKLFLLGVFSDARSHVLNSSFVKRYNENHDLIDCAHLIANRYSQVRQAAVRIGGDVVVDAAQSPARPAQSASNGSYEANKKRFAYPERASSRIAFSAIQLDANAGKGNIPSENQAIYMMKLFEWLGDNFMGRNVPTNISSTPSIRSVVIKKFGSLGDRRHDALEGVGILEEAGFFIFTNEFREVFNDQKKRAELVQWAKAYQSYRTERAQTYGVSFAVKERS